MNKLLLGKYQVVKNLGGGINSRVYLATDKSGSFVVVKLLPRTFAVDPKVQEEVFNREVGILKKFSSPAVPSLIDAGLSSSDNCFYIVSEYVPGESLSDVLMREKSLSAKKTIIVAMETLAVLDFYHSRGLIHRDLKPQNIIILEDHTVRIIDFGIAKDLALKGGTTLIGKNLGTPEYASPEVAGAEEIDHRSDLYSVGAIMYECLAGYPPFKGKSPMHTLLMVLTAKPQPLQFREDTPPELEEVVFKALQKKKADRFASAEEFLRSLEKCLDIVSSGYVRQRAAATPATSTLVKPSSKVMNDKTVIYCLDDQVFILNILKHILSSSGFEVLTFTSWDNLHEALCQQVPDIVVTDVQMPEVNGVKVCSMLKQAFPSLKVVLFSNVYENDLALLSAEAGADDWISKSWTPDVWLKKIQEIQAKN
ncbi:MAG: protein kinase [Deltaproteobacteria bacterium]|nr:protein kinase [Deltaproteobacteria bacterium]MCX7953185.1 protein kinase [Deltaproteobacteria bacterium]